MRNLLKETKLLDYGNHSIQNIIAKKGWRKLNEKERILAIYNYVRNDIAFGYNRSDDINAAKVLKEGYGQCNTKGTLFMALLRATGTPCRMHGFHIDKIVQKGAMKGFYYRRAPKEILHSWVEVWYKGNWLKFGRFHFGCKILE